jgi:ABC-type Na+ transport system ATPase subunit NatA
MIRTLNDSGVLANDRVDFDVHAVVHALLGENGAGKAVAFSMTFPAEEGHVYIDGSEVTINSPHAIRSIGRFISISCWSHDCSGERGLGLPSHGSLTDLKRIRADSGIG